MSELNIIPTKISEKEKQQFIQILRENGGELKLKELLQLLKEEFDWEPGYSLVVLTQLCDEGKIGLGRMKVQRKGPRPLSVWIKEVKE